jgi:hypothetical protein
MVSELIPTPFHFGVGIAAQFLGLAASFVAGIVFPSWLLPAAELQTLAHQVEEVIVRSRVLEAAISELASSTTTTSTSPSAPFLSVHELDWSGSEAVKAALHCPRCDYAKAAQSGLLLGLVLAFLAVLFCFRGSRAAPVERVKTSAVEAVTPVGGVASLADIARAQASQVRLLRHGAGR